MSKRIKIILTLSITLNIILIAIGGYYSFKKISVIKNIIAMKTGTYSNMPESPYFFDRKSLFATLPIKKGGIVFLGDSLTDNNEWGEMFEDPQIVNRGIQGDTTEGVLNRLDEIYQTNPKSIFIMVGINDLLRGVKVNKIASNYAEIVKRIQQNSPNTHIFIQSALPVNKNIFKTPFNYEDVRKLNSELKKMVSESIHYVDLYAVFSLNDRLNEKYTNDGIHLTGEGYQIWKETIEPFIH